MSTSNAQFRPSRFDKEAKATRCSGGRKTDRQNAGRLAEILQYGLLRGSFIPPPPVRELRDLTRRRTHLQQDRNRVINRIARCLETANIKLGSVVSDLTRKTSTLIVHELAYRHPTPERLVELAQGSLKKKQELAESLNRFANEHFRWLLKEAIQELEALDRKLLYIDRRTQSAYAPMGSWCFVCAPFQVSISLWPPSSWPRAVSI
jgi:transposase